MRDGAVRCQSAALVAEVSLLRRGLLQGRPLDIYRAVLRRMQPASALRCPQGGVSNIGAGATAQDSGRHDGAADLSQIICHRVPLVPGQPPCDRAFLRTGLGYPQGPGELLFSVAVENTRDQLNGAASRGGRITRPTVERLTPTRQLLIRTAQILQNRRKRRLFPRPAAGGLVVA